MSKQITDNADKQALVQRLLEAGHITFPEALLLLEVETPKPVMRDILPQGPITRDSNQRRNNQVAPYHWPWDEPKITYGPRHAANPLHTDTDTAADSTPL